MSTFHGLEMAKQALFAQQSGLYTTGHNISNANTKGYSRQRVNFETASPYPTASRNRPEMPGQLGTGVKTGSIERVRDKYIDAQYRTENTKAGYWNTRAGSLERMENIMSEMSDKGLSKSMDQFWESLQDLATTPDNTGAKSVVVQRGNALADSFNHISKSLEKIRGDLNKEIDQTVNTANSLLKQIDAINKQVKELEPHGYLPNDLYDERDRLIDELSEIIDIDVDYESSGDSSLGIADGVAVISLAGNSEVKLVDDKGNINNITISIDKDAVGSIKIGEEELKLEDKNGSLSALVHSYGYKGAGNSGVKGEFPEMLAELNKMSGKFIDAINTAHDANGDNPFFSGNSADTIEVVITPNEINVKAASDMLEVFDATDIGLGGASVKDFYESLIGEMGVRIQESNKMADNTAILLNQVNNQRQSISAVSLDEEMSNMIKFQHAYNAAARSMTAMDEILDKVINGMGLVGR